MYKQMRTIDLFDEIENIIFWFKNTEKRSQEEELQALNTIRIFNEELLSRYFGHNLHIEIK